MKQNKIKELEDQVKNLENRLTISKIENNSLLRENYLLKQKNIETVKKVEESTLNSVKSQLSLFFTSNQIKKLLTGKKVIKWAEEDIVRALAFKSVSARAYKFAIKKLKIPLPSISTLNKYIKDINIEPGYLNVVFKILKSKSSSMSCGERVCSLSFDEMSLTPKYCYDKSSDSVICLLYTSPSPRDKRQSRMPSSA